jgi:hypothetical protein
VLSGIYSTSLTASLAMQRQSCKSNNAHHPQESQHRKTALGNLLTGVVLANQPLQMWLVQHAKQQPDCQLSILAAAILYGRDSGIKWYVSTTACFTGTTHVTQGVVVCRSVEARTTG